MPGLGTNATMPLKDCFPSFSFALCPCLLLIWPNNLARAQRPTGLSLSGPPRAQDYIPWTRRLCLWTTRLTSGNRAVLAAEDHNTILGSRAPFHIFKDYVVLSYRSRSGSSRVHIIDKAPPPAPLTPVPLEMFKGALDITYSTSLERQFLRRCRISVGI
ncbi:hypothetical protein J6590_053990 [Homalodisca vitripennis]|nr:hypothetical protein J6590_053990 [Homalodisca vitripennis]